MKFVYRSHFEFRAQQRGISPRLAREIYEKGTEKFYDTLRNHHVVVLKKKFKSRMRNLLLAYDRIGDTVEFVTTHIIKDKEIDNKVKSGRWKHEQN